MDLNADARLARRIAREAVSALLAFRRTSALRGAALGQAADRMADQLIGQRLRAERPGDPLLSEEQPGSRARRDRLWILDPLDGTREFAEGREDWAVHIGLSVEGRAAAGAIAGPAGAADSADPRPLSTCENPPRIAASRTRNCPEVTGIAGRVSAPLIPLGSAGAKTLLVLQGRADAYLNCDGLHEWDICAPAAVALAAGLTVCRLDGSALRFSGARSPIGDVLISHPSCAEALLAAACAPNGGA